MANHSGHGDLWILTPSGLRGLFGRPKQSFGQFNGRLLLGENGDDLLLIETTTDLDGKLLQIALETNVGKRADRRRADDEPEFAWEVP